MQVPVHNFAGYLQLMVQKVGHQPQNRPFLQLMVQKMGHQPQLRGVGNKTILKDRGIVGEKDYICRQ